MLPLAKVNGNEKNANEKDHFDIISFRFDENQRPKHAQHRTDAGGNNHGQRILRHKKTSNTLFNYGCRA
jgi:hypothetical protein